MNMNDRGAAGARGASGGGGGGGGASGGGKWNRFWDDGRTKLPIEDDDDEDDDEYGNEVDHDEDDQSNNVGNDNIDANNFETFDNAAEWDEDEHEDLIARDKILSRPVVEVKDLEKQMLNIRTQSESVPTSVRPNPWSPFGGQDFFKPTDPASSQVLQQLISRDQNVLSQGPPSLASLELQQIQEQLHQQSQNHALLLLQRERLLRQQQENDLQTSNIARMLQQQQEQQRFQQQQEALLRQQQLLQQFQQNEQQQQASVNQRPKVFTVEELERQMVASRSSDPPQAALLRHNQAPQAQPVPSRRNQAPAPQPPPVPKREIVPSNAPLSINLIMRQSSALEQSDDDVVVTTRMDGPAESRPAQIERCLFAAIQAEQEQQQEEQKLEHQQRLLREQRENRIHKDRYGLSNSNNNNTNSSNSSGNATNFREPHHNHIQNQQHHSNRINNIIGSRDGARDNRSRQHNRRKYTVLPPQVQLSVLESAKKPDSIKTKYADEFLQDRMPTSNSGFFFKRLSLPPTNERHIHDGVLTDDERSWLTSIQKKIQSDYDNNLEQDYYYMLYFNQITSKKTPERDAAASQPALARTLISSGDSLIGANGTTTGHQDRRFVARERLLYNN